MKRRGSIGGTIARCIFVLLILGGLAAAAMLPTCGSPTASAATSNVISDLRSMKAAALTYLSDSLASPDAYPGPVPKINNVERLREYLDNPTQYTPDRYMFYATADAWWVGYKLGQGTPPSESFWAGFFGGREEPWALKTDDRAKLESRAQSTGLYGTSDAGIPPVSSDQSGLYKKRDPAVWMRVR